MPTLFLCPFPAVNLLQSPPHQDSVYCFNDSQAVVARGAPVRPRYLITDSGVALSPAIFANGIAMSPGSHYAGVAAGSNAMHTQQSLFANAGNPHEAHQQPGPQGNLTLPVQNTAEMIDILKRLNLKGEKSISDAASKNRFLIFFFFYFKVFQCYQPNPVASHLNGGLFSSNMFCQVGESEYALFVPYISRFAVNPQINAIIHGAPFKNSLFLKNFCFRLNFPCI